MKQELQQQLAEKFPKILRDLGGDSRVTCMYRGIECGDGWYKLLDETMESLQFMADHFGIQAVATQIKEKFGTLRFYVSYEGDKDHKTVRRILDDIIDNAERRSKYICEETGEYGSLCKKGNWLKTLSFEKAKELGFEKI